MELVWTSEGEMDYYIDVFVLLMNVEGAGSCACNTQPRGDRATLCSARAGELAPEADRCWQSSKCAWNLLACGQSKTNNMCKDLSRMESMLLTSRQLVSQNSLGQRQLVLKSRPCRAKMKHPAAMANPPGRSQSNGRHGELCFC